MAAPPQPFNSVDRATETALAWTRSNESKFASKPILVIGNNVATIHFKVSENVLKNKGLLFFTHTSTLYSRCLITKAFIEGVNPSSGDTSSYSGAASVLQASIDTTVAEGDLTSNGAVIWEYDLSLLDPVDGLEGYVKTLDARMDFMDRITRT